MKIRCDKCGGVGFTEHGTECGKCYGEGKINESCYINSLAPNKSPIQKSTECREIQLELGWLARQILDVTRMNKIINNIEKSFWLLKTIQDMDIRETRGLQAIIYDIQCTQSQIKAQLGEL